MNVSAKARNLSISAQKLRLSADLVRGQKATTALEQLRYMPQKSATMVYDAIASAMANGTHNYQLNTDTLIISEIRVDAGSKLKRFRPRSRGMANAIEHPSAHLTVVLAEAEKQPAKQATKPKETK
ncbi:MAG: 50S ribosomal protein L22 [Candidatus Saccharibacteria bacterium]